MTVQLPGLADPVHDAQTSFRALLDALSHPGQPRTIPPFLTPPRDLNPACAIACLTLLDLETEVWLSPEFPSEVGRWLVFHSGCRWGTDPGTADFALIRDIAELPDLTQFNPGTAEEPETAATLLIQVPSLQGGEAVTLTGPGILGEQNINLPVSAQFWVQWRENVRQYPQGIDIFFFSDREVVGLPRTAQLKPSEGER
ncbi:phosphonate C-P lyase system protein PhnH [Lyngbya sp. CCY1209]|uniref:phosphonate C-P lyase system protein PhnH n=1 Tax=Lyngbya sp. CCY1209 TaxID=2886103 RepID=UPI002D20106C|nr:phosphonate C-P lyase system protein PhnH [Lyngbya sp. CCY1209]MEB3882356.1 phosphonate C-P lyase system protein PhnH [Lyngbya sp. CCY1209]